MGGKTSFFFSLFLLPFFIAWIRYPLRGPLGDAPEKTLASFNLGLPVFRDVVVLFRSPREKPCRADLGPFFNKGRSVVRS